MTNNLFDASVSTRRWEQLAGLLALAAIALIPIAIMLSLRAGITATTTSGIVIGLLAASGLLALKRASLHAHDGQHGDSHTA